MEKVWFNKIGEDGANSRARCTTQAIFVGHHDLTGAVLCITKKWICTRQKLDKTATEWSMGCYELGWLVWHSVADGGSWVEFDEENHIGQRLSGTTG